MTKQVTTERTIFVRDNDLSAFGFATFEAANVAAVAMGPANTETQRIRVRFRNRTNCWDVVVKTKR